MPHRNPLNSPAIKLLQRAIYRLELGEADTLSSSEALDEHGVYTIVIKLVEIPSSPPKHQARPDRADRPLEG